MDDSYGMSVDKNIRLAEEKLFDSIFKEARLEGVPVAYGQVEAICREMPVAGLPADDIAKIKNLHKAWRFVFETVGYPVDLRYIRQINWEVGKGVVANAGDLRSTPVSMGGTAWRPELPDPGEVEKRVEAIREAGGDGVDRAIDMMLYIMRAQLFLDGNKRTAQLVANQMLISQGLGVIAVPEADIADFLRMLVTYYETNAPDELKIFLRRHCLLG